MKFIHRLVLAALLLAGLVPVAFAQTTPPTTAVEGQKVVFTVVVSGTGPFAYKWQKAPPDASPGAFADIAPQPAGPVYTIPKAALGDAGQYRVVVSNAGGSTTSNTAVLNANPLPPVIVSFGLTISPADPTP